MGGENVEKEGRASFGRGGGFEAAIGALRTGGRDVGHGLQGRVQCHLLLLAPESKYLSPLSTRAVCAVYFPCKSYSPTPAPLLPQGSWAPSEPEHSTLACSPACRHPFINSSVHLSIKCGFAASLLLSQVPLPETAFYPAGLCFQWRLF